MTRYIILKKYWNFMYLKILKIYIKMYNSAVYEIKKQWFLYDNCQQIAYFLCFDRKNCQPIVTLIFECQTFIVLK